MILVHTMNLKADQRVRLLPAWEHPSDQAASSYAGRLARALLRYSAANFGGFPDAAAWMFSRTSTGQPQLETTGPDSLWISFSHSGDWVACALATTGPIGIDIEIHRQDRDLRGIAALGFSPEEQLRSRRGVQEFYRIWTIREAIAKASGAGLERVTDRLDYASAGPMTGSWRTASADKICDITHVLPAPYLSLACATHSEAPAAVRQPTLYVSA